MFRKTQLFSGKRAHALPWTIAFIGSICLSVAAYGLYVTAAAGGGKVETVMQPSAGAVEAPKQTSTAGGATTRESGQETSPVGCENLLLMVGPSHILTADYVPPDLVYLSAYGMSTRGSEDMLRQEAAVQLERLISAAAGDGVEVLAASGYRSYWEQQGTFAWFKNAYGEDAGKLSVPPGQSEHQLGTAVDFASSEVGYELVSSFSQTSAGMWLTKHAAQYGFILSYKEDQKTDTGVGYEPWHYRYIGVAKARETEAAEEPPMSFHREGMPYCYGS